MSLRTVRLCRRVPRWTLKSALATLPVHRWREVSEDTLSPCRTVSGSVLLTLGADGMWIELIYTGGHSYTSHCNKQPRTTRIVFLCDSSIEEMVGMATSVEVLMIILCYFRVLWISWRRTMRTTCAITSSPLLPVLSVVLTCHSLKASLWVTFCSSCKQSSYPCWPWSD